MIQFDEPAFNVFTSEVKEWGIEALHRAIEGLTCKTAVHICYGYGIQANIDWKKTLGGEWRQYEEIFPAIAASRIQEVSIECRNTHVPLELLGLLKNKDIQAGVIDVANEDIETADEIATLVGELLRFVPKERLLLSTNCGMAPMTRAVADAKLKALGQGARSGAPKVRIAERLMVGRPHRWQSLRSQRKMAPSRTMRPAVDPHRFETRLRALLKDEEPVAQLSPFPERISPHILPRELPGSALRPTQCGPVGRPVHLCAVRRGLMKFAAILRPRPLPARSASPPPAVAQQPPAPPSIGLTSIPEAETGKYIAKSNASVGLLNASIRASDSWRRYLSWADAKRGPTGKERIIYGMYSVSVSSAKDSVAKARESAAAEPAIPALDGAMKDLAAAFEAIVPILNEGEAYYDRKDYMSDKMAGGQALHASSCLRR